MLDTAFLQDASRLRTDNGPENLTTIQHWALNLIRGDKATKGSVQTKRKRACWNDSYLVELLTKPKY